VGHCTWLDITKRRQMEEALRETNVQLQAIVQASPLAVVVIDLDWKIKYWSPAAERILAGKKKRC